MLTIVARVMLFLAVFVIDVRVKADNLKLQVLTDIQEQPENCWKLEGPCAVRTLKFQSARFSWLGGTVTLDEVTTLVRGTGNELRLINGTIWLRGADRTIVRSEFGTIEIPSHGEGWLKKSPDQLSVADVDRTALIRPQGSSDILEVSSGLENWIGRVGADGKAQTGIPVAIVLKPFLRQWAKLYSGSLKQLEADASSFYVTWSDASRLAAQIHQDLFTRKCASIESEETARDLNRRKVQARNHELIEMFRRHVFEE
jgi:hypothetical protein